MFFNGFIQKMDIVDVSLKGKALAWFQIWDSFLEIQPLLL